MYGKLSKNSLPVQVEEAGEEREAATSDHKGAVPILPYDLGRDPFADPFVRNHSASILDELQFKVLWRDAHPVCVCPRSNRMQANLIFEAQPVLCTDFLPFNH
eukprot:scaffold116780_cov17-Tisochrysis_lutea.AAC.1